MAGFQVWSWAEVMKYAAATEAQESPAEGVKSAEEEEWGRHGEGEVERLTPATYIVRCTICCNWVAGPFGLERWDLELMMTRE